MKITVLIENTSAREDVGAEHGLSLYVEVGDKRLLFDMGQSNLLLSNAERLGVDLSAVDLAVLSHGHYDHGGGLSAFLQVNAKAPVYVHRLAFGDYLNGAGRYIGLDPALQENPRLIFGDGRREIGEGMTLLDCNTLPRTGTLGAFGLCERTAQGVFMDRFLHEQYLILEEDGRRVLISGCSHKGIVDIAQWIRPDVLIGGFHLSKLADEEVLSAVADQLEELPIQYYTCHCTGELQYRRMKERMHLLSYLRAGDTVEI